MTPKGDAGDEPDLTLQEAADLLGVHYMTAYRYVRTGRLPGRRIGAHWHVRRVDLDQIVAAAPAGRTATTDGSPKRDYVRRLTRLLVKGDEPEAWRLLQSALGTAVRPRGPVLRRARPGDATRRR